MAYVVTGATGFLGRFVARALRARGFQVLGTGRDPQQIAARRTEGIAMEAGDLAEPAFAQRLLQDAEGCIHCAALASPWGPAEAFERANVRVTENVVAALPANAALVHVSSPSVYGVREDTYRIRETHPKTPYDAYARTKWRAEGVVRDRAEPGVILRPRALYGPEDQVIIPRVVDAMRRRRLPRFWPGDNLVDLTYIEDAADAAVLALEHLRRGDAKATEAFNVTSDSPVPLLPLLDRLAAGLDLPRPVLPLPRPLALAAGRALERVARVTGKEPLLSEYSATLLTTSITLDISKAREVLGYEPRVDLDEGVRRYLRWRTEHPEAA